MNVNPGFRGRAIGSILTVASLGLAACSPSLDVPSPEAQREAVVDVHGAPVAGGIAEVVRFEVKGTAAADLRLFEGTLSEYYERRVRERDLPESLRERELEALTWDGRLPASVPGTGWLGNLEPLVPGQRYSLAALGVGLLGEFDVALEQPHFAERIWPPVGMSGQVAIFCPEAPALPPTRSGPVALDACGAFGDVSSGIADSGLFSESCVSVSIRQASLEPCLVPLSVGDAWLAPTALDGGEGVAVPALECEPGEIPLGNGCSRSGDTYFVLRKPLDALWILTVGDQVTGPSSGDSVVVRGLASRGRYGYSLLSVSSSGAVERFSGSLETEDARPRVVLNEVLANPNGPEPTQEWIEVYNAGSADASLEGYLLQDGAGEVELPPVLLGAGQYALLVTPEYDRVYPFDLSPSKQVQLIVVEQLGKSGLSNSGEPLILRDASGQIVSGIPPLKHDRAGYSVARRAPELSDVLTSFQTHGAPGASPGEANYFDPAED